MFLFVLSSGYILWINNATISTLNTDDLVGYIRHCGHVKDYREILGAVFDNMDDVELFVDRLEKKYIWKVLKE